jgi:hypothetical protein
MVINTAIARGDEYDPVPGDVAIGVDAPVSSACEDREKAIDSILSSIAMEELALSHVLNAEGEKIQFILGTLPGVESPKATFEQVIETNESVRKMMQNVMQYEMIIAGKMETALDSSNCDICN